ncbi:Dabb family protein [Roseobacter sp. YSTF-M11]|uniref:Dabb family protein n=1 Tax=Roseobacter insulae TaxID=2859783 RepID=A0A9X1FSL0_9RHOB|nr:Dabb family protein [Roseobacter insulae]MBW4706908.1 Dabb family protein [Roseobacter insulae]
MIRHIVLTRFATDTAEETIAGIYGDLERLTETLAGAGNFGGGRSQSPEQIERGYMHGFTIDFDTWDDLRTYAEDEHHKSLGAQIVALAAGGLDGVLVLDIEV